jgi:hypothetical protein
MFSFLGSQSSFFENMGNAGSNTRDRHKSGEAIAPSSPGKDGQAFVFDKKPNNAKLVFQSSHEEEEPYYAKEQLTEEYTTTTRQRSATVSEGTKVNDKVLPTVFKWEGGGKQVFISGTFSDWKTLPMVKRYKLFLFDCKRMFWFCRQIFRNFNILLVASVYILEVVCYIKMYRETVE